MSLRTKHPKSKFERIKWSRQLDSNSQAFTAVSLTLERAWPRTHIRAGVSDIRQAETSLIKFSEERVSYVITFLVGRESSWQRNK